MSAGRQMLREWILNDLEQCGGLPGRLDFQFVQQLDHESGKPLVGARDATGGINFNEYLLLSVNVNLQQTCLVERRVHEGQQFLMQNVGTKVIGILV